MVCWKKMQQSVDSFNIKKPSYQYRNSHYKHKIVLQPLYFHNGSPYTSIFQLKQAAELNYSARLFPSHLIFEWKIFTEIGLSNDHIYMA